MVVKNEVELAVAAEVKRLKNHPWEISCRCCWCPLCEADVTALSLSWLHPCYCTYNNYCLHLKREDFYQVEKTVRSAARRVCMHPKHRPASPGSFRSSVRLVNFTYREAFPLVGLLHLRSDRICRCRECFVDILALALNHYPARYGVEHRGRTNLDPYERDFIRFDMIPVIARAALVVMSHPHH